MLTGVRSLAAAERVAGDTITLYALLRLLRERYDDVVIDLGTETTNLVHEVAARADLLLVVTWPTPDAVNRVAMSHMRLVRATGLSLDRCRLVINHVGADSTAMPPPLDIVARLSEAGPLKLAGIVAQDIDLVGRARLRDPDRPLLPVLLSDGAARRSRLVRGLEDLVEHVRPGVLPAREGSLTAAVRRAMRAVHQPGGGLTTGQLARADRSATRRQRTRDNDTLPWSTMQGGRARDVE